MISQASTMLKMSKYGNKMREMYIDDLQLASSFGADIGQAILGDPCYLDTWKTNVGEPFELADGRVSKVVIDFEGDRD